MNAPLIIPPPLPMPLLFPPQPMPMPSLLPPPLLLRDVGLYRPPESKKEMYWRSNALLHILTHLPDMLKNLFQTGYLHDGLFRASGIIVAVERAEPANLGIRVESGEWVDPAAGWRGRDLAELYAYLHHTTYASAMAALAERLGVIGDAAPAYQYPKTLRWTQERHPLYPHFPGHPTMTESENAIYRNAAGNVVGIMQPHVSDNGDVIPLFKTIWRKGNSQYCHVAELFPEKPYMLYNMDAISRRPDHDVVFAQSEHLADVGGYSSEVYSAIPGGMDNILDADLSVLSGRRVHLRLRIEDLRRGRLIMRKLRDAGTSGMHFSLGPTGRRHSFDELEAVAAELGVGLLPLNDDNGQGDGVILNAPGLHAFLNTPIPPRAHILEPVIPEQGLVMLHAPRGIGKTQVGLGIAYACASGTPFLRWRAPIARSVLYIDGEMPAVTMQERLEALIAPGGEEVKERLSILTPDNQKGPMPDIGTVEGQKAIETLLPGVSLIIIDNLSTLCRNGGENGSESWACVQSWFLNLRRRGKSVLVIHHSGKSGNQRGTSKREDILDTVIKLKRPENYSPSEGARFEVHLEKARGIFGEAAMPFEAALTTRDGKAKWSVCDIAAPLFEQARALFERKLSVRQVAETLGISKSAAGRLRMRVEEDGWCEGEDEDGEND